MVTVFYQDGSVTLYHANCEDVLPAIGRCDLLLTDPPYGIGERMQGGTWGATAATSGGNGCKVPRQHNMGRELLSVASISMLARVA